MGDVNNDEILAAYQRCDLVLFASTHEGFGLPILEAQAVGRPVVTGNCSSMPGVAGDAACLVDPFDSQSIRAGVEQVVFNETYRTRLISRGFENAQRFSATRIAAEYARLYREIATVK
jgi:glycosyltransferase involved in cell wall biosynthesis